ncbi:MAG: ABC transporter substrate-binding protein [Anaerolineae bacterium]|nr:ABC transporter substrate-binding protein [Anaerolineae bacterium]
MKRLLPLIALLVGMSLIVSACRPRGPETIKIGLNVELTGSIPVVGASCKNAAELAVEEVNNAGGLEVGGRKYKIELLIEDNEDKKESAAAAAQKLNAAGVLVMIGPNASRNAIPAAEVAEANKMPMISPWSTNPKTTLDAATGQPKKYVMRACFIDDFQGVVAAKFAITELKVQKPAVLYAVDSEYNKGIAEIFKKTMEESGVPVVAFESYTTGDKDFSAQLTKIIQAGADSLFLPNYYTEVPLQVQQAHKLGFKGVIFGSDSWGAVELIDLCGADCEGYFFTTHYAPDIATPKAQAFIKAYEAKYGKIPDDVAALTYDAFGLAFQAIQAAGKIDREAVNQALHNIARYEGVTGVMQFKGTGDPVKSAVVLQIKGRKFVYYTTAQP